MSKRKIIRDSIFNENVVDTNFDNQPSSTLFRLGTFTLDTNLEGRVIGDFSNKLTTFSKEYTLETIGLEKTISQEIYEYDRKLFLNFDYKNITSYARYGSLEDLFKYSIKNIVKKFPYSLFMTGLVNTGLVNTVLNFAYDELENVSTFNIPRISIININNIIVDSNNNIPNEEYPLNNFNLTKEKYVVWDHNNPNIEYPIIGFTGNIITDNFITIKVKGKLFNLTNTNISKNYHIRPSQKEFNKFLFNLNDIEKYFLCKRVDDGYSIGLKVLNDNGIGFTNKNLIWFVGDEYNINIEGVSYLSFINDIVEIGKKYDEYKTDIIYRMYTTTSLKEFDTTNDSKMSKLIRSYGYEFDKIKRLIDGFATLNNLTYKKENSIPDILVKNVAKVLGWEIFDIVKEDDLLNRIFSIKNEDISESLIPSEIDIELWNRILLNTKWFFKSKGTRKSLDTIFKLIGVPEQFIQLKEYIYLAENKLEIEDRKISTTKSDIFDDLIITNPSSFNNEGYPISVPESSSFFFQISGTTDSGQTYLNRFRENGFKLKEIVDNKKSWLPTNTFEVRSDENTLYSLDDSELIINTKEIDAGFNPSNALEFDIYKFNQETNYPICGSNNNTVGVLYMNTPLIPKLQQQTVFEIPDLPEGDIQVSLNGLTLAIDDDYIISGSTNNKVVLLQPAINELNGIKDIVTLTYVTDLIQEERNLVEYVVTRLGVTENNQTIITLPDEPLGDIQLVLNGITLNKNTVTTVGDFYLNPLNSKEIIIISNDINNSLKTTDILTVMFLKEVNNNTIEKYVDSHIITSFFGDKLFFNNIINKYVFITDYNILNQSSIKIIINGITLNPGFDYFLNPSNKNQIIFASNVVLKIGDIVNGVYVIDNNPTSNCISLTVDNGENSFFGYTDNLIKNLINVKNRKIITNNDGGVYPKLSLIYDLYTKANKNNNIYSNGYTYSNLYSYIKRFDNHFTKLLFQLLPATTIFRKAGLIVSNSLFSKQKYKYIRGINDGSEFISQTQKLTCDLLDFTISKTPATTSENLGSLTIDATGFNDFIQYSIDGGEFYFIDNTFTDLQPGNYNITLKDDIGCIVTGSTQIVIDCNNFTLQEIITTNQTSDTNLGSIEIIASGDTNIFYSIDSGINYQLNNNKFNNLINGNYDIIIKNSLDCIVTGNTITLENDCDLSITEFEFGSCDATGFIDRFGSSLTVVNNTLALNLIYNFTTDNQFSRFFREKVVITETTTSHVLLEKFIEFEIEPGVNSVNLGNVFIYNVPTYQNFEFTETFSNQNISCTPFTTPLPNDVFIPLPDEPEITYELTAVDFGEVYNDNGGYELSLGAQINNTLSQNIIVNLNLPYDDNGILGVINETIIINQGEFNGVINTTFTSSTGVDSTTFGIICIDNINYTGSETIILINPCE